MSNGLVSYVHVTHPEQGLPVAFGPDDDLPDWAAEQMGAHCFEGGVHPHADRPEGTPPPRNGPGSSKDAWAEYAIEKDVEVPPDASREQIIAALADAGIPVDPQ
jgi:hypothetical protein